MVRFPLTAAPVLAAVILAVFTPTTAAQSGEFERVTARVLAGWVVQSNGKTRFDELVIYNATQPTSVRVACHGKGCGFSETPDMRVRDSGILRLTKLLRGLHRPVPAGTILEATLSVPNGQKVVAYRTRRRGDPILVRRCTFSDALPSDCSAPCPPPAGVNGDYCATAGLALSRARDAYVFGFMFSRRHVKVTRLWLGKLQPGVTVAVFCHGEGCPFGARFYSARGNSVRLDEGLRGRALRFGTVLEVRALFGNALATVRRIRIKRRGMGHPTTQCLYPAELAPRDCPD